MRLLLSREPYTRLLVVSLAAWLTMAVTILGFRDIQSAYFILIFWMTSSGLGFLSRKRANPTPAWMDAVTYPLMGLAAVFMRGPGMWLAGWALPVVKKVVASFSFF